MAFFCYLFPLVLSRWSDRFGFFGFGAPVGVPRAAICAHRDGTELYHRAISGHASASFGPALCDLQLVNALYYSSHINIYSIDYCTPYRTPHDLFCTASFQERHLKTFQYGDLKTFPSRLMIISELARLVNSPHSYPDRSSTVSACG